MSARPVLLYDADCRFCRFVARAVVRLDRRERLAFLPIGDPEAAVLLSELSPGERLASIHVIEDGRRLSRGAALSRVISRLDLPLPARVLGMAYGPVAGARAVLGRLVPDGPAPRRYP